MGDVSASSQRHARPPGLALAAALDTTRTLHGHGCGVPADSARTGASNGFAQVPRSTKLLPDRSHLCYTAPWNYCAHRGRRVEQGAGEASNRGAGRISGRNLPAENRPPHPLKQRKLTGSCAGSKQIGQPSSSLIRASLSTLGWPEVAPPWSDILSCGYSYKWDSFMSGGPLERAPVEDCKCLVLNWASRHLR